MSTPLKDKRRLELAQLVASWSKDHAKVGAAIADRQGRVVALGYNGFAGGLEDSEELLNNNDEKQERTVHAELNAVLIASRLAEGGTLYVYGRPVCARCAGAIIQAGISRVVNEYPDRISKWTESHRRALSMFEERKLLFERAHYLVLTVSSEAA